MKGAKMTEKIPSPEEKTFDNSSPMHTLRSKLQLADPEIQKYVSALKEENLKCAKKLAKLQAENVSLNNRITALNERWAKAIDPKIHELIELIKKNPPK